MPVKMVMSWVSGSLSNLVPGQLRSTWPEGARAQVGKPELLCRKEKKSGIATEGWLPRSITDSEYLLRPQSFSKHPDHRILMQQRNISKFCHLKKDDCPALAGVGARAKRLVGIKNINVYALGFYIDESAAKNVLGPKFKGKSADTLSHSQDFCTEVIKAKSVPKTVRIVITSKMVNGDRFSHGIEESMGPVLQKMGDKDSLEEFKQVFRGAQFHNGLELSFSSTPEGALATRIGDKEVGAVRSPVFTDAFFSMYLGEDPVSQDGKGSITHGLAHMIASE